MPHRALIVYYYSFLLLNLILITKQLQVIIVRIEDQPQLPETFHVVELEWMKQELFHAILFSHHTPCYDDMGLNCKFSFVSKNRAKIFFYGSCLNCEAAMLRLQALPGLQLMRKRLQHQHLQQGFDAVSMQRCLSFSTFIQ